MKPYRLARVNEAVREEAANAILFELKDPRVKGVTVTRAEVSADLQHAKVYVSVMGSEKEQKLTMYGLQSAAGFVQTRVAKRLTTRFVPHVTFVVDEGIKKSLEVARLIRQDQEMFRKDAEARAAREAAAAADAGDPSGPETPGVHPPGPPTPADGPAGRPD